MNDKIAANSPFSLFETDASVEREGIKLDYGPFYLRVARAGGANTRFAEVLREKMRPHRRAAEMEILPDELSNRLAIEAFAETVVLGWGRHETDDGGKLVVGKGGLPVEVEGEMVWRDGAIRQFTVENVKELFTLLPDLARDAIQQAQRVANFRKAINEADTGN